MIGSLEEKLCIGRAFSRRNSKLLCKTTDITFRDFMKMDVSDNIQPMYVYVSMASITSLLVINIEKHWRGIT